MAVRMPFSEIWKTHLERVTATTSEPGSPIHDAGVRPVARWLDRRRRRAGCCSSSNALSRTMTHHLRARHDAILVGINTVLTDDPRLTVRLAAGKHPRPVVIDGCLRMPMAARLLASPAGGPIVATSETACRDKEERLRKAGAVVMRVPAGPDGRLDLAAILDPARRHGRRAR